MSPHIELMCLFVNGDLTSEQFETIFLDHIAAFESLLESSIYLKIVCTNFTKKNDIISLKNFLREYLISDYPNDINHTNDSYIEKIIDSDRNDTIAELLRKRYEKKELVSIECSNINTPEQLIAVIKKMLQFPQICGNSFDAINDLIYDIMFPEKLILNNWNTVEKKLPRESEIIRNILCKRSDCEIIFEES
ncbi:MAG: barstar family protein [Oscillospiraceae bacterium]|nr:barstar family protein [Oscillospiraceae bacterium]